MEETIEKNNIRKLHNFDESLNDENKELLSQKNNNTNNIYSNNINYNNNNNSILDFKDIPEGLNLSRYKSKKLFGITFYRIGNIYAFGFINESLDPLFCIDYMWYFHLMIYFVLIILLFAGNYFLFRKLELWKQIIYNVLLFIFFLVYSALTFLNPGIVIRNQKGYKHIGYCRICNIYFLPEENVSHCYECNICVKRLDHHCSVVRKCITKKNMILFILMIVCFVLLYVYSLVHIIYFFVDYYKRIKKK